MLCLIDNYDSFTYNIVQYLQILGGKPLVIKNDEMTIQEIMDIPPSKLIISPGPCTPKESGVSLGLISHLRGKIPILGVCLGHQVIAEAFGGKVVLSRRVMHGKVSEIKHNNKGVFKGVPCPFKVNRYHSLIVERESLPKDLEITAWCESDDYGFEIMGLRHARYDIEGVQFHPESIFTEFGLKIIKTFLYRKYGRC
ncbi:anthranilate synthase component II [Candidatus Enterovibrio escicola]|uniref:Anthranilate synthase, amidotransferase n=1 Tax=Candidatus Enterovibrio escicola TaxID=1927127 RepID=A0A2A5T6Q0_9GAMM|nr:aminodeoxychorismate/anthranilate synthase component II [Candidatus Enterovibrio escacola]PCS23812.1 Anthranilate synthase, amidotransferase [Candidatus Enterovibrio escacola]